MRLPMQMEYSRSRNAAIHPMADPVLDGACLCGWSAAQNSCVVLSDCPDGYTAWCLGDQNHGCSCTCVQDVARDVL